MTSCRNTYIEVNTTILEENARLMRAAMPPQVKLCAVVKANAYGHGSCEAAAAFIKGGAEWLAVALPEEGEELRNAGIKAPILVLAPTNENGYALCACAGLTASIHSLEGLSAAERAAANHGMDVHLTMDTGLSRDGFRQMDEWREAVERLKTSKCLRLTGAFMHFADADGENDVFTRRQMQKFNEFAAFLPNGIILHAASNAAALRYPETRLQMVRPGIALYGYPPVETDIPFKPALSFYAEVTALRWIEKGDAVSYGCTFTAKRRTRIATLAAGYGDGVSRAFSPGGAVLIRGARYPIVGRICMDQMMADVTDSEGIAIGDKAVLIGRSGNACITAQDVADVLHTISYEVLLSPSRRVPIVYTR